MRIFADPGLEFRRDLQFMGRALGIAAAEQGDPEIVVTIPHIGRQMNRGLESRNSTGELVVAGKVGSERVESAW